ncbi:NAC domain-containing protein 104 [Cajanus cajan]|uniref:NAC domain-containing protein 68 n=1 Tax=Cajanus cajan TaxID=3821 RepID=A0A151TLC8_CAJCA|nr:NAC domain-containing protein 104 [Cajanus cajan]KYP67861.1 NAC domain-containing protein 68 [Cajanus cajan]
MMACGSVNLPPGFCFSPTDEELVLHFLRSKASLPCHPNIIPELDLSHLDPWKLNGKALSSGNQHYFFTKVKENRSTENGYWKEIGVTEPIVSASEKVGFKKYLVFNHGEAPQGTETSWVMQEYHICSSGFTTASCGSTRGRRKPDQSRSKWVLCKAYEKKSSQSQQGVNFYNDDENDSGTELSWLDEFYMTLDDDLEEVISMPN